MFKVILLIFTELCIYRTNDYGLMLSQLQLERCFKGPNIVLDESCYCIMDFDGDRDNDLKDYSRLLNEHFIGKPTSCCED